VGFIYQRLSMANYSGVVLSRRFRLPLILEYNGSEAWIARNWGRPLREQALAEKSEELNLRHAHLVVTISEVLRGDLIQRGVDPRRIVVYPNCIDPKMFNPTRFSDKQITDLKSQLNISSDSIVVTFVGTFGQWHGVEVLAQAIRQLIDFQQDLVKSNKIHFMLVGDGVKMLDVRSILGEYGVGGIVTLTGLVLQQEAPLYLAASDILVSPHVPNPDGSPFFGSPTKLFEYMAMGKAIIASDLDQIGDVLRNSVRMGVNESLESINANKRVALLIKPGDPCELAKAIVFLAENSQLRKILGQNAQCLANDKYTWISHVNEILAAAQSINIL
jgi:glycosyltransferase involved in cell wall biosynthesis